MLKVIIPDLFNSVIFLWLETLFGFLSNPFRHTHRGRWELTIHSALIPQLFTLHGFLHFCAIQAMLIGHSLLTVHSGRGSANCK